MLTGSRGNLWSLQQHCQVIVKLCKFATNFVFEFLSRACLTSEHSPHGVTWNHMESHGITWSHMESHGVIDSWSDSLRSARQRPQHYCVINLGPGEEIWAATLKKYEESDQMGEPHSLRLRCSKSEEGFWRPVIAWGMRAARGELLTESISHVTSAPRTLLSQLHCLACCVCF